MDTENTAVKQQQDDEYITIPRSLLMMVGTGLLGLLIGGVIGYVLALTAFNRGAEEAVAALSDSIGAGGQPAAQPQPTQPPARLDNVSVDDDPYLGPEDAPITIVEFSDFR